MRFNFEYKKPKIVAEIGWNFLGNMKLAKEMISSVKNSGCNFVKFQLWDPKNLKEGPWDYDGRKEIYKNSRFGAIFEIRHIKVNF